MLPVMKLMHQVMNWMAQIPLCDRLISPGADLPLEPGQLILSDRIFPMLVLKPLYRLLCLVHLAW